MNAITGTLILTAGTGIHGDVSDDKTKGDIKISPRFNARGFFLHYFTSIIPISFDPYEANDALSLRQVHQDIPCSTV